MRERSGHDQRYKRLFSHPRMMEELLRGFLRADWVERLDFSTLERVGSNFISEDHRERRADVIWRVRWKDGTKKWFHLYILLELQSSSDPFMAVRLQTYVGLLLEEIVRKEKLKPGTRLPAVLSIVFHNGRRPWRTPLDLESLFVDVPEDLQRQLPRLPYLLLDQGRLDLDRLDLAGNRVAILFRIEVSRDPETVLWLVQALVKLLPPEEDPALRRTIIEWLISVLRRMFRGITILETVDLEDFPMSLEENMLEWRNKNKREGMHQILLRQLKQRFGPIPAEIRRKVEEIQSTRRLNTLADKILTAGSLQELGL
ncbi:MAG TPA: Rpn family recombination-promoting nuclease/putative transposase [Thermoanaerobaculia bacterium]